MLLLITCTVRYYLALCCRVIYGKPLGCGGLSLSVYMIEVYRDIFNIFRISKFLSLVRVDPPFERNSVLQCISITALGELSPYLSILLLVPASPKFFINSYLHPGK